VSDQAPTGAALSDEEWTRLWRAAGNGVSRLGAAAEEFDRILAERLAARDDTACPTCAPHPEHGRYACRRNGDLCGCPGAARDAAAAGQVADGPLTDAERAGGWYESGVWCAPEALVLGLIKRRTAIADGQVADTVRAALRRNDDEIRHGHGANRAGRRALADELLAALDAAPPPRREADIAAEASVRDIVIETLSRARADMAQVGIDQIVWEATERVRAAALREAGEDRG
jgi:hypothetical protein